MGFNTIKAYYVILPILPSRNNLNKIRFIFNSINNDFRIFRSVETIRII